MSLYGLSVPYHQPFPLAITTATSTIFTVADVKAPAGSSTRVMEVTVTGVSTGTILQCLSRSDAINEMIQANPLPLMSMETPGGYSNSTVATAWTNFPTLRTIPDSSFGNLTATSSQRRWAVSNGSAGTVILAFPRGYTLAPTQSLMLVGLSNNPMYGSVDFVVDE